MSDWTPEEQKIIDEAMAKNVGIEKTPGRKKQDRRARKKYAARAKRKSGPVTVRYVCPICGDNHSKADHRD